MAVGIATAGTGVATAKAAAAEGSITVTQDGTVLDGREVDGYVHIKANNVTIRNSTLRYDGNGHTVRVFDGFTGTRIENSDIICTGTNTNGVVFGNYWASRVDVTGCRKAFVFSDEAPATIIDSTWNGEPVGTDAPPEEPGPVDPPAAFPGPNNTGVPAGTTLTPSGSITVRTDGQIIEKLDITGCVTVRAKNVVIRKSRISCDGLYSIRTDGAENLLVEDVEIDGRGTNSAAVCCGDYTLRRVDISNTVDGPRLGDNTVVESSWIHGLARVEDSHNDVLQTTGAVNVLVRGNTLESYNPATDDPFNACLMVGSTTAPLVSNLVFEGNYCNGGNYSIGVRTDLNASGVVFRNNQFGRDFRYGVIARPDQAGITWDRATNVWADSRLPVVP